MTIEMNIIKEMLKVKVKMTQKINRCTPPLKETNQSFASKDE